MKISEQRQGAIVVLRPEGPLAGPDVPVFRQRLLETLSTSLGRFVIDMSAMPFVDSDGLEALLDVTEEMNKSGQILRLCAASKTIREVLDLTDLSSQFDHFEDTNTAVRSFL